MDSLSIPEDEANNNVSYRVWNAERQRWTILPPRNSRHTIWVGSQRMKKVAK